jgi:hypothetical protein
MAPDCFRASIGRLIRPTREKAAVEPVENSVSDGYESGDR